MIHVEIRRTSRCCYIEAFEDRGHPNVVSMTRTVVEQFVVIMFEILRIRSLILNYEHPALLSYN